MHSRSHVVTKERMKSLQDKQEYDQYGHTNKNGMQREVSKGIQISKHGAKSERFIINLEDKNDDQSKSQPKKVKFVVNPPKRVKLTTNPPENNDEEPKKEEIPTPGFKRIERPWPIYKVDIPEDKTVYKHHLRLPEIPQNRKAEMQAKGITVKRHMQSWLEDNEFYEEDLPAMKKKYSRPKNLDEDLVSILEYVKTEEFRQKKNYIRLVFSQNAQNQASLNKQVEKDKQKFIEERLDEMNETIQPTIIKKKKRKVVSRQQLEKMNKVIQSDKPKKKSTSRSQVPRAKPNETPFAPRIRLVSKTRQDRYIQNEENATKELIEALKKIYTKKTEEEIKEIAKERVQTQKDQGFVFNIQPFPIKFLNDQESEIHIENVRKDHEKEMAFNRLALALVYAHPGMSHEESHYETHRRLKDFLDNHREVTDIQLEEFLDEKEFADYEEEKRRINESEQISREERERERQKEIERQRSREERQREDEGAGVRLTAAIINLMNSQTSKSSIQNSNQLAEFNDFWLDNSNDNSSFQSFSDSDSDVVQQFPSDN